ncbi:type 1 glutamine amidotransferase domain-containing protein [Furfurilactobacillus siliginis]|uniref:DJ-1/PfpI domain-containing protein n=1 Tax=Furfurilactobacillus siliginis TaxID=348151 RepID=A0A0R2LC56_9LACO|nr:type 1 glutamine amidotransferase domain-containing protein [Furfurilactobacillus siliginis]KRN97318.1 hypothetical protein IV55_GL000246 [Furfurilactobacillus siliginis]GEK29171.1 hypothetical protein LSI01_14820 [Furfurilactobacillus siliginis]
MNVLIPIPTYGFDPTEAAIPWQYLTTHHVSVTFATPAGTPAAADARLLTGKGFGPFKQLLMADKAARTAYQQMIQSSAFTHPLSYDNIDSADFSALLLPGGHDKAIKEYLESSILRQQIVNFFAEDKLVGAICHGTVAAARAIDPQTHQSVLANFRTTSLLKIQELGAYYLTCLWLGTYYRTYPQTVADEVQASLTDASRQYRHGHHPFTRDTADKTNTSLVTVDQNYVSARWPGDAHRFAQVFYDQLINQ